METKPRTIEEIQRDNIRKTKELLKIGYRLMAKVGTPRPPFRMRDKTRKSSDHLTSPLRDWALR